MICMRDFRVALVHNQTRALSMIAVAHVTRDRELSNMVDAAVKRGQTECAMELVRPQSTTCNPIRMWTLQNSAAIAACHVDGDPTLTSAVRESAAHVMRQLLAGEGFDPKAAMCFACRSSPRILRMAVAAQPVHGSLPLQKNVRRSSFACLLTLLAWDSPALLRGEMGCEVWSAVSGVVGRRQIAAIMAALGDDPVPWCLENPADSDLLVQAGAQPWEVCDGPGWTCTKEWLADALSRMPGGELGLPRGAARDIVEWARPT